MSYSRSLDMTTDQYRKIVPEFLHLLSKYSYSQAKIQSQIKLVKGDQMTVFSDLSIKDILEKLTRFKFHSGKIMIHHKNKTIQLARSRFTEDLTLELDFIPGSDLKAELENLLSKKKKIPPTKEADEIRKAAEKERKKELKDRKKELERELKKDKKIIVESKEAEKKLREAEGKRLKADKIYAEADKIQKEAEKKYEVARKEREKKSKPE
ncbi:MAG: hypothetical protein ACFE8U_14305 [Candidatus Hermodarchaeota archaeon]